MLSRALLRGFVTAIAVVIMMYVYFHTNQPKDHLHLFDPPPSEQLIPMFGLVSLEHATRPSPQSTIDKARFLVHALVQHRAHGPTTIVSFSALGALVAIRWVKERGRRWWFVYRVPEVLVVVIVSTSACCFRLLRVRCDAIWNSDIMFASFESGA